MTSLYYGIGRIITVNVESKGPFFLGDAFYLDVEFNVVREPAKPTNQTPRYKWLYGILGRVPCTSSLLKTGVRSFESSSTIWQQTWECDVEERIKTHQFSAMSSLFKTMQISFHVLRWYL